jgi:hypothetical protein
MAQLGMGFENSDDEDEDENDGGDSDPGEKDSFAPIDQQSKKGLKTTLLV